MDLSVCRCTPSLTWEWKSAARVLCVTCRVAVGRRLFNIFFYLYTSNWRRGEECGKRGRCLQGEGAACCLFSSPVLRLHVQLGGSSQSRALWRRQPNEGHAPFVGGAQGKLLRRCTCPAALENAQSLLAQPGSWPRFGLQVIIWTAAWKKHAKGLFWKLSSCFQFLWRNVFFPPFNLLLCILTGGCASFNRLCSDLNRNTFQHILFGFWCPVIY